MAAAIPSRLRSARELLSDKLARGSRQASLWREKTRAALGVRRGLHAGGVYYKELSAKRLARALSPRGGGVKDYRVTFSDGSKQYIRCARGPSGRCYADLMGPEHLPRVQRIAPAIRPGSRLLEIATPPMLTGYTAEWLGRAVGASGAVVSLSPDEEGARFGARRYAAANLSIEHVTGTIAEALAGEIDGAFDGVVHLALPSDHTARTTILRELWRVVAPGGWLLAGFPAGSVPDDVLAQTFPGELPAHDLPQPSAAQGADVLMHKARPTE